MTTKIKALLGACALTTAIGMSSATAAGAVGPSVDLKDGIYATCTGLGDVFIITLPGRQSPGFILDGTKMLIPFDLRFTQTFTPTGGEPETQEFAISHRAPKHAQLSTCTGSGTEIQPEGTYVFELEVHVAIRGA